MSNNNIPAFQIITRQNIEIPAVVRFGYKGHQISISNIYQPQELVIFKNGGNRIISEFGQKVPSAENIKAAMDYIDSITS